MRPHYQTHYEDPSLPEPAGYAHRDTESLDADMRAYKYRRLRERISSILAVPFLELGRSMK
jgi:hypothetical protein